MLDCDVILNDETFDENGTPSGGDGVIYSWSVYSKYTAGYIEGNGHCISGEFFKDDTQTTDYVSLFGEVLEIQNLSIENGFLKAGCYVFAVGLRIGALKNVQVKNVFLTGVGDVAGFSNSLLEQAIDCSYSGVISNSSNRTGGLFIAVGSNALLEDCCNYADINCVALSGGLISQSGGEITRIKNCANYGNINCSSYSNGGAIGISSGSCVISNFKNYGKVISTANDIGGIVGRQEGDLTIERCFNMGKIETPSTLAGEFVGNIRNDTTKRNINCLIRGFEISSYSSKPVVSGANVVDSKKIYVEIKSGRISYNIETSSEVIALARFSKDEYVLSVSEVYIAQKSETLNFNLVGRCVAGSNFTLKNIYFFSESEKINSTNFIYSSKSAETILSCSNIIIEVKGKIGQYYGSDFSGFYCDWKTGRVGLKSLDGVGFYQGEVTEEILINKGFVKQTI